jgi:hypothetical protein
VEMLVSCCFTEFSWDMGGSSVCRTFSG